MIRGGHDAFLKNKKGIVMQSELEEKNLKTRDVLEEGDPQWVYLGETWLESYNNYMIHPRPWNVEDLLKNLKEIKLVDFVKGKQASVPFRWRLRGGNFRGRISWVNSRDKQTILLEVWEDSGTFILIGIRKSISSQVLDIWNALI